MRNERTDRTGRDEVKAPTICVRRFYDGIYLGRGVLDALQTTAKNHSASYPILLAFVAHLHLNEGGRLGSKEASISIGIPEKDGRTAWRALMMDGWLTITGDLLILQLPGMTPDFIPESARGARISHPLLPLCQAWEGRTGEAIDAFSMAREYQKLSEKTTFAPPANPKAAVKCHLTLYPESNFVRLLKDWSDRPGFARLCEIMPEAPDAVAKMIFAATALSQHWGTLRGASGDIYVFCCAALAGLTPAALNSGMLRAGDGCSAYMAISYADLPHLENGRSNTVHPSIRGAYAYIDPDYTPPTSKIGNK